MTAVSVIDGDRTLPPAFDHPHASEQARAIAEVGMILRVQVGSGCARHLDQRTGRPRRDGHLAWSRARFVTGLARVPAGTDEPHADVVFEQYQRHTVWDQPSGLANRSGAGDLDVVICSARKWCGLALAGNPRSS